MMDSLNIFSGEIIKGGLRFKTCDTVERMLSFRAASAIVLRVISESATSRVRDVVLYGHSLRYQALPHCTEDRSKV